MEPAAENGGAVFVSAQLAHAERRTVWLRRFCFRAAVVRSCIWYDFFCPHDTVSCVLQANPNKIHAQQDPVRRTAMAGCAGGQGCSLFLAQSLRARLHKELPSQKGQLSPETQTLSYRAKQLLVELTAISPEIAQMVVSGEEEQALPNWFLVELVREIPALTKRRNGA